MERMKELIDILNQASKAYYQDASEIMSNYEYDKLYDELLALEKETGIVLASSPTQNVGYQILSQLPKEAHPSKMLSLDKTKERDVLRDWLKDEEGILSWKLDGLTIVLTYEEGRLVKGLTRGNGEIGEVITPNVKNFSNVPLTVPFKGRLVLRGEAIITYSDFEKINDELGLDAKYKNPRNLCSGSVRQLNPEVTRKRNVHFIAFTLVESEGREFKTRKEQLDFLKSQGFDVVEGKLVNRDNILDEINWFSEKIEQNDFPSDGLVLTYDDIAYGRSLGTTAKFPRDAIAFKWKDEMAKTTLREIEWSPSRTGLINPVAIFDPVELEGTTVTRASVHNISVMEGLKLGIGDTITVYKANMIIPQIEENLTCSGKVNIPSVCPVCGEKTVLKNENGVKTLVCPNEGCPAKDIKLFTLFVSRDALNIDGLSEATLEKFIEKGFLKELPDLFKLDRFKDEIVNMEGFGEKSYTNLISALREAKNTVPERLLYGLGITGIGKANARLIAGYCHNRWDKIESLTREELLEIEGVGEILADSFLEYFKEKKDLVHKILDEINLDESEEEKEDTLAGMTFVITGSLNHYENRDQLKEELERKGAKVASSVSAKTTYLVNNDILSTSGKNKKAKELGIEIISEDTLMDMLGN
ncbi:MAG: NAD-dependent DNA ligase LigA [Clostridia bacterium]|nr:NAD-dependent DNA ligase LigA [Clostridia bacterium]